MKKLFAVVAMLVAGAAVQAEEKCLAVGEGVAPFYVTDVTGPSAGEKLCYRCRYGSKPVVSVFARKMTPEVAALTKEIDGVVGANEEKKMAAFVVLMTDKPEESEAALKTLGFAESGEDRGGAGRLGGAANGGGWCRGGFRGGGSAGRG